MDSVRAELPQGSEGAEAGPGLAQGLSAGDFKGQRSQPIT